MLDLFSVEHPDRGPTEVAYELGIAKSTGHALLGEPTSVALTERMPCGPRAIAGAGDRIARSVRR